jgi:hypothetical protein
MELIREKMNVSDIELNTMTKIYISEEQNVSDIFEPFGKTVKEKGSVAVERIKIGDNNILVSGTLDYSVLYQAQTTDGINGLNGKISINEQIRIPDISEENTVDVSLEVEKISVSKIADRKIMVKAVIAVTISLRKKREVEIAVSAKENSELCTLTGRISPLEIVADTRETFRIRDEITVPQSRGNLYKIVWNDISLKSVSTKLLDHMIHVGGELYVFMYYITDDKEAPIQWHAGTVSFSGNIEMPDATEEMISYVNVSIRESSLSPLENDMGECEEAKLDVLLNLDIKIYSENEIEMIKDVYCPYCNVIPEIEKSRYNKLLIKNSSKNKYSVNVSDNMMQGQILQICSSYGSFRIEEKEVTKKGLEVKGIINVGAFYISSDDGNPVGVLEKEQNVTAVIDVPEMKRDDEYYISARVEQVSANNVSSEEIEIKVSVIMELIVFEKCDVDIISGIEVRPLDEEVIRNLPMLKGHMVQKGDTIWKLAKENYTTPQSIEKINDIKNGQIKPGDKILIAKSERK